MSHIPTPWAILDIPLLSEGKGIERLTIVAPGNETNCVIARIENIVSKRPISAEDRANAEYIVRAVNSHAELLAALEGLVDPDKHGGAETFFARYEAARAAIAKAKS